MLHRTALQIAQNLVDQLQPHCNIIHIAGSIRRQKPEVKDIEIICLPKTFKVGVDLFGQGGEVVRSVKFINAVNSFGEIKRGNVSVGKYMQIEITPDLPLPCINLDLFMPEDFDYYRQFAIRTGSADYAAKVIATGWRKIGWCGSDKGLRPIKDCYEKKRRHR